MEQHPWSDDGCDRCGHSGASGAYVAKAQMRYTLPSGMALTLCGHHGKEVMDKMTALGARLEESPVQV